MRVMPVVKCKGCPVLLEFGREDVKVNELGTKITVSCPLCSSTMLVRDIMPALPPEEEKPPEPVPEPTTTEVDPPEPSHPRADTEQEKSRKALKAYEAYQKTGTFAGAAKELGVSIPTVKRWLEFLPPGHLPAEE